MEYFINIMKKAIKSMVISIALIIFLWSALYSLTDFATIGAYLSYGLAVCLINTIIANLRAHRIENVLKVSSSWIIMAGAVLVLYHSGFTAAAIFLSAAILASPFFGASLYESIVGLSLLITLARIM